MKEKQRLDERCLVFLLRPALSLCKQRLGAGLKRKRGTEQNGPGEVSLLRAGHWARWPLAVPPDPSRSRFHGCGQSSGITGILLPPCGPPAPPASSTSREKAPLPRPRKGIFLQNRSSHGRALGQTLSCTLKLTRQSQLILMPVWGAGVAALSRWRLTSFTQSQKMFFCGFWWLCTGPPVSPITDGQTVALRVEELCKGAKVYSITSRKIDSWW